MASLNQVQKKLRILVLDDDNAVVDALGRVMSSKGEYDVVCEMDPLVAVECAREAKFDVILSDINMPKMNGIEFLQAIRGFDSDVPVILLTGVPSIDTAQKAVEYGAFRYLIKPISPRSLLDIVKQATFAHRIARLKREAFALSGSEDLRPGDIAGMNAALDSALESMWMAYQPIISAEDEALIGYEAFIRSDEKRLANPTAVLEAAEKLNRVHEVGRKVREHATAPMGDVSSDVLLFLNLHPEDLLDETLGAPGTALADMADRTVLEITERASLSGIPDASARIEKLQAKGYRIAIDDLGSGYAGLSTFAMLKPDMVKIDMSLTHGIDSSPVKRKLVRSMVDLCHDLDIMTVAEGIETIEERETCKDLGCDFIQGFYHAKPGVAFPQH